MSKQKFPDLPDPTEIPRGRPIFNCNLLVDWNNFITWFNNCLATVPVCNFKFF